MNKLPFSAFCRFSFSSAPLLDAQTVASISFGYRWGDLACASDDNAYDASAGAGQTTEILWCPVHWGAVEGNQPGGGAEACPFANNGVWDGTDEGNLQGRGPRQTAARPRLPR